MAKPTTETFSKFIVEIETAVAGTYAAPCGFTSKALTMSAATSETNVPDCDNPEAAAWTERGITSLSGQVTGSGVLAAESSPMWEAWFDSAAAKNIRIRIPGVGYRQGSAYLTDLGASVALGSDGNKVQRSVTIVSNGPWSWTVGNPRRRVMSRSGEVTLPFGSEERTFRLTIGAWRKVQEKCDAGPPEIARRLGLMVRASSSKMGLVDRVALGGMGDWRVDDVREPLYQGLIGAGLDAITAGAVIRDVVDGNPLADAVASAFAVVMASLVGAGDEPASGEALAGEGAPISPRGKLRFGEDGLYAIGQACGLTPLDVDALSLWQFAAAVGGFARANGAAGETRLNAEEAAGLSALLDDNEVC